MGMYDDINCEYPLPDAGPGKIKAFQTKSFGDGFTGGFMDNYTITYSGTLVFHKVVYESVPEKERPYYGTPEWDKNPLLQICGSMKHIPVGDEEQNFHGILNMYTNVADIWYEYNLEFTRGKVTKAERIYREFGNG